MDKIKIEKYWSGGIDREDSSVDVLLDGNDLSIAIFHSKDDKWTEVLERGTGATHLTYDELDKLIIMLQEAKRHALEWDKSQ